MPGGAGGFGGRGACGGLGGLGARGALGALGGRGELRGPPRFFRSFQGMTSLSRVVCKLRYPRDTDHVPQLFRSKTVLSRTLPSQECREIMTCPSGAGSL